MPLIDPLGHVHAMCQRPCRMWVSKIWSAQKENNSISVRNQDELVCWLGSRFPAGFPFARPAAIAPVAVTLLLCPSIAQPEILSNFMSNAEREDYSLAVEAFHASIGDHVFVTCVTVDYQPKRRRGR